MGQEKVDNDDASESGWTPSSTPRVLLVSMRGGSVTANRCFAMEVEDVIEEIEHVDRMDLTVGLSNFKVATRALLDQYLPNVSALGNGIGANGHAPYDLVFVSCAHVHDLRATVPLQRLLRAGKRTACLMEEIWTQHLPHRGKLNWLKEFDYLFTSCSGAVEAVEEATGKPTAYLPPSLDTFRWSYPPHNPERCIDVLWYGRRVDRTHEALKRLAADKGLFYMYDTRVGSPVIDKLDHRVSLAGLVQRARFVYVNPAKADRKYERGMQLEIGYRFFEAAGGGAVLIGDYPRTPEFDELFGWPDVVFEVPMHTGNVETVLEPLLEERERCNEISIRNRMESVRRHDTLYRWEKVLETVGMPATPEMKRRRDRLEDAARALERQLSGGGPSEALAAKLPAVRTESS